MWSTADIAGKPADVFEPAGVGPRFGLLFLHPVGQETLRGQPIYTRLLEDQRLACVCPQGGYSWWADRLLPTFDSKLTAEKYVLQDVVPFFRARWQLSPPALGLFGISMGGQGALRLAFKHAPLFPAVAGIASALDYYELYGRGLSLDEMYDSKEQCRQDGALLHVHPSQFPPHIFFAIDPDDADWYRGNDRLHEKLAALGVPHTCDLTTRAGGHSWDYFNHMAATVVQFLVDGLEKESRRLL
jgi:S-formylglutathione hydrolase FrmB